MPEVPVCLVGIMCDGNAYPDVSACLTEMPGENSAPCFCFSKLIFICTYIIFAHTCIYFTVLFNMLSKTDPRSFSLEIWVYIFVFYILSISSVIVDLLPSCCISFQIYCLDLHSGSAITQLQPSMPYMGKYGRYVSPLQCYWIALLFFKYCGICVSDFVVHRRLCCVTAFVSLLLGKNKGLVFSWIRWLSNRSENHFFKCNISSNHTLLADSSSWGETTFKLWLDLAML